MTTKLTFPLLQLKFHFAKGISFAIRSKDMERSLKEKPLTKYESFKGKSERLELE